MPNTQRREEQVAVACMCAGTAVVVALFLVPRTPSSILVSVGFIYLLTWYPAFVFIPSLFSTKLRKWVTSLLLVLACAAFVDYVWPDTEPVSDLAVDQSVIQQPYAVGSSPNLNLDYFNFGAHTIKGKSFNGIRIFGGFPSQEDEDNAEELLWGEFRQYVATATDASSGFPFPPHVKSWVTLAAPSFGNTLTPEQFQNLQDGNGRTVVIWVSVLFYKDASGEHEVDFCGFTFNKDVVHLCRNHNGPAEPMPHHGFSFPRKWF